MDALKQGARDLGSDPISQFLPPQRKPETEIPVKKLDQSHEVDSGVDNDDVVASDREPALEWQETCWGVLV